MNCVAVNVDELGILADCQGGQHVQTWRGRVMDNRLFEELESSTMYKPVTLFSLRWVKYSHQDIDIDTTEVAPSTNFSQTKHKTFIGV